MSAILPCWGRHARMGHVVLVGYVEPFAGSTVVLTEPAVDGDDEHGALPEIKHVLPMDGPAFFGFTVITEEEARTERRSRRPWPGRRALRHAIEDADEIEPSPTAVAMDPPSPRVGMVVRGVHGNGGAHLVVAVTESDGDSPVVVTVEPADGGGSTFDIGPAEWARVQSVEERGVLLYEEIPF